MINRGKLRFDAAFEKIHEGLQDLRDLRDEINKWHADLPEHLHRSALSADLELAAIFLNDAVEEGSKVHVTPSSFYPLCDDIVTMEDE